MQIYDDILLFALVCIHIKTYIYFILSLPKAQYTFASFKLDNNSKD